MNKIKPFLLLSLFGSAINFFAVSEEIARCQDKPDEEYVCREGNVSQGSDQGSVTTAYLWLRRDYVEAGMFIWKSQPSNLCDQDTIMYLDFKRSPSMQVVNNNLNTTCNYKILFSAKTTTKAFCKNKRETKYVCRGFKGSLYWMPEATFSNFTFQPTYASQRCNEKSIMYLDYKRTIAGQAVNNDLETTCKNEGSYDYEDKE
ncbi:MAG: hypothetical protein K0R14_953 [Burkholderiales bacterium]|jgi:hypothetical protein|nr:hypothetical protein [Burkholderiales bacterium]